MNWQQMFLKGLKNQTNDIKQEFHTDLKSLNKILIQQEWI